MTTERDNETIARLLREDGVNAEAVDGWVYVTLKDGSRLCISAEWGASLEASVYAPGVVLV